MGNRRFLTGISPLIAAVLLIAFTMAIAGLMATWATSFSEQRLQSARSCALALDVLDLDFNAGTITVRVVNNNNRENMTDLKASLIYDNPQKNKDDLPLKDYSGKSQLGPTERMTVIIPTNDTARPRKIEVVSGTCPSVPATEFF